MSSTKSQLTSLTLLDRLHDTSDEAAWSMFIEIYRPLMYRCLHNIGIDPADVDDLVQDCLSKVLVALPGFVHNGRKGAFRNWLRTVVSHRAIEFLRHRQRGTKAALGFGELTKQFDNSIEEFLDREHDRFVVSQILDLIRPEFTRTAWEAFERQVVDEVPASLVANELGRSVNAVLLYKSRVLRRLRELGKGLVEC